LAACSAELRRLAGLLDEAEDGLLGALLFALAEAEDEGAVLVLLERALAEDDAAALNDGHADDLALVVEDLRHADLLADDAGILVHDSVCLFAPERDARTNRKVRTLFASVRGRFGAVNRGAGAPGRSGARILLTGGGRESESVRVLAGPRKFRANQAKKRPGSPAFFAV